ncbi:leucine-rich PPR motif-containing protein, mitochondrial-like [Ruditapes philippinarum]|uniref:leucine-rich PPR motif-containing protein, mitochondrial-like n=1 Tax=Ruditapes philippinarum TaxID=129788 RepID=UPI00295A6511|nr:leucine-rich PPR motif-containing protein, mitochondrial-like [Ruditapes philippinarum]
MSALARCARYSKHFSRSFQSYCRNTATSYLNRQENLFGKLQAPYSRRLGVTKRLYTVLSGENNAVNYDEVNTKEETNLDSQNENASRRRVLKYSENYPASNFWKNYDFSVKERDLNFTSSCRKIYHDIFTKKFVTIERFHELMAIAEQQDTFTEDELLLLFSSLGRENKDITEAMRNKWTEYLIERFHTLNIPLDVSHYNEALRNYLIGNHRFSPVKFLSEMEKHGVTPNVFTLSRVVSAYCRMGDVKSAGQILEHMRKAKFVVNEYTYRHLIKGNFLAGDAETAMKLFDSSNDLGFAQDSKMYEAVITGYAMLGDLDGVKEMLDRAKTDLVLLPNLTGTVLQALVQDIGKPRHQEIIDYFTSEIPESGKWEHTIVKTIKSLMESGHHDLAFNYFSKVPGTCRDLIKAAINVQLGTADVVKYIEMMKRLGLKEASFSYYFTSAIEKFQYESAIAILPHVVAERSMRSEFIWPLVRYHCIMKNPEGMEELVPFVQNNDYISVINWLEPNLRQFGRNIDDIGRLLKKSSNFNEGQVNALMIYMKKRGINWKESAEYARSCELVEDINDGMYWLLTPLISTELREENWRDIAEVACRMKKNDTAGFLWNVQKVADLKELKDYVLEKLSAHIAQWVISGPERAFSRDFKELFSPEELETVAKRRYTHDELRAMNLSELLEVYELMKDSFVYKIILMRTSFQSEDWKTYKNVLNSIQFDPSKTDMNIFTEVAYYYAVVEGDILKSCETIAMMDKGPFAIPNFDITVKLFQTLCENGRLEDATKLIKGMTFNFPFLQDGESGKKAWLNLEPTPQNIKKVKKLMTTLSDKGYFKNRIFKNNCLKNYWDFICGSEDFSEVTHHYDYLSKTYEYQPNQFVQVFSSYIKKGDKTSLQAAFDKLTDYVPEQKVLVNLAAAFIENEEISKAKKVLMTPGLRIRGDSARHIVERWARNGQPKHIETFGSLCSSHPGDVDIVQMRSLQLQAFCNQKNPDVDACISFFERYFEYDDDIEVDVNTLKFYANFLRKHRPEKKLDTFFLNMIESDKERERFTERSRYRKVQRSLSNEEKPKQEKTELPKVKKVVASSSNEEKPKQEKAEPVVDKDKEDQSKLLIGGERLTFDEVQERFHDMTDEELHENLPSGDMGTRFVKFLNRKRDIDLMKRLPDDLTQKIFASNALRRKTASIDMMQLLYERHHDKVLQVSGADVMSD